MDRKLPVIILLIFCSLSFANALDLSQDFPEEYTLGICTFRGVDIRDDQEFFLRNIPGVFLDSLMGIPERRLSAEDLDALEMFILEQRIQDLKEQIGRLVHERDELFFRGDARERDQKTEAIEKRKEEIELLAEKEYETGEMRQILPIVMERQNKEGELLPPPGPFVGEFCRDRSIDILVFGTLEQVDEFFYLQVEVYDTYKDTIVFRETSACSSRELALKAAEIADSLTSVILGRPWAALSVETEPPSASIYLDGNFVGAGMISRPYIVPGTYSIECRAPGFEKTSLTVTLEPQTERNLSIKLIERERAAFTVETDPEGADLYLASQWVGKSPLEVIYPGEPCRLTAVMDGYRQNFTILTDAPEGSVRFTMQPLPQITYNIRDDLRNRFYKSFGYFALSIPVSLGAYAVYEHYYLALKQVEAGTAVSADEFHRLWLNGSLCYTLSNVGLFANVFLFIHMVVTTAEYIQQAGPPAWSPEGN